MAWDVSITHTLQGVGEAPWFQLEPDQEAAVIQPMSFPEGSMVNAILFTLSHSVNSNSIFNTIPLLSLLQIP